MYCAILVSYKPAWGTKMPVKRGMTQHQVT